MIFFFFTVMAWSLLCTNVFIERNSLSGERCGHGPLVFIFAFYIIGNCWGNTCIIVFCIHTAKCHELSITGKSHQSQAWRGLRYHREAVSRHQEGGVVWPSPQCSTKLVRAYVLYSPELKSQISFTPKRLIVA